MVKPNLAPLSYVSYEGCVRLYIAPYLGAKRLDRLAVRDVREWLTKLATVCQCCAQGKDAKRAPARRKCCAVGDCCEAYPSRRVIQASRDALRAALTRSLGGGDQQERRLPGEGAQAASSSDQAVVRRRSRSLPRGCSGP